MDLFSEAPTVKSTAMIKHQNVPKSRGTLLMANLYSDLDGPHIQSGCGTSLYDGAENKEKGDEPAEEKTDDRSKRKFDAATEDEPVTKKQKSVTYILCGYVAERKGEREEMQDMHVIDNAYNHKFPPLHDSVHRLSLYAVFDGHGGTRASKYAAAYLPSNIRSYFPRGDMDHIQKNLKRCFVDAFKKTDDDFLREASKRKPTWKDGTTAVCVLAINDVVYIGNLGDSKAVLCRRSNGKYLAVPLSVDHSPSTYDERVRIQRAGGHVSEGRVMGILEVSRSIGDGQYKNHGVVCTPDVKRCQLTDNDRFIVLACDGLWKTFTSQETIDIVNKTLDEPGEGVSMAERYEAACTRLVSRAVLRLSADNVTVVIVAVHKQATPDT